MVETIEGENLDAEVSAQAEIISEQDSKIAQLAEILAGKAGGSGNSDLPYVTGIATVDTSSDFTIPELAGFRNVMLYELPTISTYAIVEESEPYPIAFICWYLIINFIKA